MATKNFTDFTSVEPSSVVFTSDQNVNSFPRHEVVKLGDGTFIQWQQQVQLIVCGYDLKGMLDGTLPAPSSTRISKAEKTTVVLTGLPSYFDTVVSSASLSSNLLPFQYLVNALLECKTLQFHTVQEMTMHTNLVEGAPSQVVEGSICSGHPLSSDCGRSFQPSIQCQICSRFSHLAQCYFYRFSHDFDGSLSMARATPS
ncbi:hypothetical protein J1N35_036844 [Gossypium stocksii]|uniref:Uncharacterized protein n=1 Tax=Gossypium stocksii TaxID=47602 RepID=A0A9D3UIR6_9ROSI|nr:hypothetical protein J1N35_036844 [Gossypium stocksii]